MIHHLPVTSFLRVFSFLFFLCALTEVRGTTFHVTTNGNDTNTGTERKPFASLTRARDGIRKLKFRWFREPITVVVHGGTYSQNASLEVAAKDS